MYFTKQQNIYSSYSDHCITIFIWRHFYICVLHLCRWNDLKVGLRLPNVQHNLASNILKRGYKCYSRINHGSCLKSANSLINPGQSITYKLFFTSIRTVMKYPPPKHLTEYNPLQISRLTRKIWNTFILWNLDQISISLSLHVSSL